LASAELAGAPQSIAGGPRLATSELAVAVRNPIPDGTGCDRAHALLAWLAEHLDDGYKVELPSPAAPCIDGFRRYYVRRGGRRAVVRVMSEFLTARGCEEYSAALLSMAPTILDLIRAGALHIDIDEHGVASALHPPCR